MPTIDFTCEVCAVSKSRYTSPSNPPPRFCGRACMTVQARTTGLGGTNRHYTWTPAMDLAIRTAFRSRFGSLKALADTEPAFATIPYYMVKHRAKALGLVRTLPDEVWHPDELAFAVERWERGANIDVLWLAMRQHGWCRRRSAIIAMMDKEGQRRRGSSLSVHGVAQALGLDDRAVRRWVDKGWLATETHVSETIRLITPQALRRFVIEHPWEVAKGVPSIPWFIALLTDPDIRANTPRATQRRRQEA